MHPVQWQVKHDSIDPSTLGPEWSNSHAATLHYMEREKLRGGKLYSEYSLTIFRLDYCSKTKSICVLSVICSPTFMESLFSQYS